MPVRWVDHPVVMSLAAAHLLSGGCAEERTKSETSIGSWLIFRANVRWRMLLSSRELLVKIKMSCLTLILAGCKVKDEESRAWKNSSATSSIIKARTGTVLIMLTMFRANPKMYPPTIRVAASTTDAKIDMTTTTRQTSKSLQESVELT